MKIGPKLRDGMNNRVDMQGLSTSQITEYSTIIECVLERYELCENGDLVYRRNPCDDTKIRTYLLSISDFPFSPVQISAALGWLHVHSSIIYNEYVVSANNIANDASEWRARYFAEIIEPQWTSADRRAWDGIKYVVRYDQTLIVAPTGKGREYKVIGTDAREVYKMLSTIDYKGTSRLDYMRRTIITPLEEILYNTTGALPSLAINPDLLSGAISEMVYKSTAVFEDGEMRGFRFTSEKKPVLVDYISRAIEVFLSRPEYRIVNIEPISNDPDQPTFCFIDLPENTESQAELLAKIPAYVSFSSIFEDRKYTWPVFCAYCASVVTAVNRGKQALWIHGHGDDAKSKFLDAWHHWLGDAATPIDIESMSTQFGMSRLESRRLVTISDNKNPDFIRKGWFHKASGGDVFDCERKNRTPYKAKSVAKFIICENIAPNINLDERNQTSRLIYIKMRKRSEQEEMSMGIRKQFADGSTAFIGSATFGQELIDQWPDFIKYCMAHYAMLCETNANIAIPTQMAEKVSNLCGDPLDQMLVDELEYLFVSSPDEKLQKREVLDRIAEKYGDTWIKNGFNLQKIKNILTNIFNVTEHKNKADGRYYLGIKLRCTLQTAFKKSTNELEYHKTTDIFTHEVGE